MKSLLTKWALLPSLALGLALIGCDNAGENNPPDAQSTEPGAAMPGDDLGMPGAETPATPDLPSPTDTAPAVESPALAPGDTEPAPAVEGPAAPKLDESPATPTETPEVAPSPAPSDEAPKADEEPAPKEEEPKA